MTQPNSYNSNPTPHRTPRQARKVVYFYGNDVLWLTRLINAELKVQRSLVKRKPPNTSEYMMASRRAIECEQVLARLRKGRIEWNDQEQSINQKEA